MLHKAGRFRDALRLYRQYLDAGAEGSDAQSRLTQTYISEVQAEVEPDPLPLIVPPIPVYKKWWLWSAVGATVIGISLGLEWALLWCQCGRRKWGRRTPWEPIHREHSRLFPKR